MGRYSRAAVMITSEQLAQLGAARLAAILLRHSEYLHTLAHKEVSVKRAHDKHGIDSRISVEAASRAAAYMLARYHLDYLVQGAQLEQEQSKGQ